MVFQISPDTPNGVLTAFTVPGAFVAGSVVPTINGRTRTTGWSVIGKKVKFQFAPDIGDVVGFFYTEA